MTEIVTTHGIGNPVGAQRKLMTVEKLTTNQAITKLMTIYHIAAGILQHIALHRIIDISPLLEIIVDTNGQSVLVKQSSTDANGKRQLKGIGHTVGSGIRKGIHVVIVGGNELRISTELMT